MSFFLEESTSPIYNKGEVRSVKKLKQKLLQARSYVSIKTYKRPKIFVILLMVLINIIILVIAALIALSIDDSFTSFIDAFANGTVKWMLTPNAILTIENPNTLFLAVIVLVIGIVLFSGVIIALTTNTIKEYFEKKDAGSGQIYLENHVLILNWNNKVPELVSDLLFIDDKNVTLMILADVDKTTAEKQIMNVIRKNTKKKDKITNINVLVKKGDPLIKSDLHDVSIEQAKAVLIMNKDDHEDIGMDLSKSDLNVIKVILSLGQASLRNDVTIVSEIKKIETKQKILTLSNIVPALNDYEIIPICFDRRLGQIIVQTILQKEMEEVYLTLFSFEGAEAYNIGDVSFDDVLLKYSHNVPLARIDNKTFVLSGSEREAKLKEAQHILEPIILKTKEYQSKENLSVYIIGKNNKLQFILESFKAYEELNDNIYETKWIEPSEIPDMVKSLNEHNHKAYILLLSDEAQQLDALDANVIDSLIYLEEHLRHENINIVVELLDPKNDPLVQGFNIENTIISNKIISLLLSKLALYPKTAIFYENLLTIEKNGDGVDDQAVFIYEAKDILDTSFPISFAHSHQMLRSIYESFDKKYTLIGYIKDDVMHIFEGSLSTQEKIEIQANDQLILIVL